MNAESSKMGAETARHSRNKRNAEAIEQGSGDGEVEARRPKKARMGKLAGLLSLPLDILFEIFGHLKPFDLLKLARMTKEFRRLLMHRSSISVWKSARKNVPGLPGCPPDMTEPQWANLAFDPHCHFCFTSGVRAVEWRLRVRICGKCAKEHMHESYGHIGDDLEDDLSSPEGAAAPVPILTLIPRRPGKKQRLGFLTRDFIAVKTKRDSIQDANAKETYVKERREYINELFKHATICENWAKSQILDRTAELHQLKDDRRNAIIEELIALGWEKDINSIEYPDSLADHKLVRQPHRLTPRIWSNIKKPILEYMGKMREKRLLREHAALVIERKSSAIEALRTYKNARLPCIELMPEPVDFCEFPAVKAILNQPSEVEVDEASFAEVIPLIPDLFEAWRADVHEGLHQTIKSEAPQSQSRTKARFAYLMMMVSGCWDSDDDADMDVEMALHGKDDDDGRGDDEYISTKLQLATTIFECTGCSRRAHFDDFPSESSDTSADSYMFEKVTPLFYPQVLGHACLTRKSRGMWSWYAHTDPSKRLDFYSKERSGWSSSKLRLDKSLSQTAESLIQKVGMDPATTTTEEMDRLDAQFVCVSCLPTAQDKGKIQARPYAWRDAVKHNAQNHTSCAPNWKVLSLAEVQEARLDPDPGGSSEPDAAEFDSSVWLCVHCHDLPQQKDAMTLKKLKAHVDDEHNIPDPIINTDYFRDFAAPPESEALRSRRALLRTEWKTGLKHMYA